jgi:hypothetical protein
MSRRVPGNSLCQSLVFPRDITAPHEHVRLICHFCLLAAVVVGLLENGTPRPTLAGLRDRNAKTDAGVALVWRVDDRSWFRSDRLVLFE